MPLARPLPERTYRLARELTTYSIVGVVNTGIDFALFNGLIFIGWLYANTLSTVVSSTTSYFMNRHWVYRDRPRTALHRGYALFFAVNLVGLVIQAIVLWGLTHAVGTTEETQNRLQLNLFKCIGVVVALLFRFFAYRTFVFKPHPAQHAAPKQVEAPAAVPATAITAADPAATGADSAGWQPTAPRRARRRRPSAALDVNPIQGEAGRP